MPAAPLFKQLQSRSNSCLLVVLDADTFGFATLLTAPTTLHQ